jgi:hypothetical protein
MAAEILLTRHKRAGRQYYAMKFHMKDEACYIGGLESVGGKVYGDQG